MALSSHPQLQVWKKVKFYRQPTRRCRGAADGECDRRIFSVGRSVLGRASAQILAVTWGCSSLYHSVLPPNRRLPSRHYSLDRWLEHYRAIRRSDSEKWQVLLSPDIPYCALAISAPSGLLTPPPPSLLTLFSLNKRLFGMSIMLHSAPTISTDLMLL